MPAQISCRILAAAAGREYMMSDDSTLLRRYAEGRSNEAFAELVRRHLDFVFSVALREVHGDFARAQDVTQEVFTALARKASALSHRTTLAGWLHLSVQHAAAGLKRAEQRRQKREQTAFAMLESTNSPGPGADWERLQPVLNEVVQELGEVDRDAVLLRFYQQWPLAEIGTALRLSEDAVQKRVERALDKMRSALVKRGITSTTAALGMILQTHAVASAPVGLAATISQAAVAAAGASGGAAFLLKLGGIGKIQLGIAAAVVVAGGATLVVQQRASAARNDEGAARSTENGQILSRPRSAVETAAGLQARPAAPVTSEGATTGQDADGFGSVPAKSAAAAPHLTSSQIAQRSAGATDPSVLRRLSAASRKSTLERYAPFLAQLDLTAEQKESLIGLLEAKALAPTYLAIASLQNGVDPREHWDEFQVRVMAEKTAIERKIRAFLGDDVYREYLSYNRSLNQESTLVRLERIVGGTADALTPEQSEKLQQLMVRRPGFSTELIAEAATFLSSAQMEALHEVFLVKGAVRDRLPPELFAEPATK